MRTRTYDNDPDRPDDNAAPPPPRFSEHATHPDTPQTVGTDAEAEAFVRINTQRNRERAAAWLESWGLDP